MISGTAFRFASAEEVAEALQRLPARVLPASEAEAIQAECRTDKALCLACDDGVVIATLQPCGADLELFVNVAAASRHGAFERQVAAMLAIARELGAKTLAFRTRRRGWSKRLGPEWSLREPSEFVRPVDGQ